MTITAITRTTSNLINSSLIILKAIIAMALSLNAVAQPSGPGLTPTLTITLSTGRVMAARVTKVSVPPYEGDELAFPIVKDDDPDLMADQLLTATHLPGFDSYAELRTNLKTRTRIIVVVRTRVVEKPAVKRSPH